MIVLLVLLYICRRKGGKKTNLWSIPNMNSLRDCYCHLFLVIFMISSIYTYLMFSSFSNSYSDDAYVFLHWFSDQGRDTIYDDCQSSSHSQAASGMLCVPFVRLKLAKFSFGSFYNCFTF